jgi:hypothetical protein
MTEKHGRSDVRREHPDLCRRSAGKPEFQPESYIDFTKFSGMKEMIEFVREVDNNRDLYLKMLAAPFYRDNMIPKYARDDLILAFFDRIVEAALARR